jgi:hypothetical protein
VLLVALCLVWVVSIVADSAQFSASVAELSDRAWVGTMLTLQTAMGFTLTLLTIHLMPYLIAALGWQRAFVPLAIGPAFGVYAMVPGCGPTRDRSRWPGEALTGNPDD